MITFRIRFCLLGWLVLLVLCAAPAGATKYVDCTVASEGGGTSWGDAFKTISNAVAQVTNGEEIWVAQGLYTNWALETGMDVGNHTLLGGYPTGGGTRDWVANPTILDGLSAKRAFDKTGADLFTLDGFTVQNCQITGSGAGGGALVCAAGSLEIRNCFFTNNVTVSGSGGAIRTDAVGVTNIFSNCTFTANTALGTGAHGGAFFARYRSTNTFVSCTFVTNRVNFSGGAVSAYESAGLTQVRDCVFSNNVSSGNGGAIYSVSPLVVSGGTNVFCGNYASGASGGGAIICGSLSVYNALFTNNVADGNGAIRSDAGSGGLISNCTFTANAGLYGAAVYMAGANTYTFDACTFETNRASGANGGAISLNVGGGLLRVQGCTFANNVCSGGSGGAIHSTSPLEISGSITVIRGNVSSSYGGAINSAAALTIRNCSFTSNNSTSHGGAIYVPVASAENLFSNCTFTANATATGWGGALYMNGASINTFDACTFVTNTSSSGGARHGGAISLNVAGGLLNVKNCAFTNNASTGSGANGGAIYSVSPVNISGSNNVFYGNVALLGNGGAICGTAASAANGFSNCTFTANEALGSAHLGGAVYLSGASSTNTLMNCAFVANTATGASGRAGGVYFVGNSADNRVMNCTFFTNTSASQGGAVYLGGSTPPTLGITNSIFWMDVSAAGGAIYRSAGTIAIAYTCLDTNKIYATVAPTYGDGMTNVNPLFASETAPYDVHLKSTAGRWLNGGWVVDDVKSPCIDAGDTNSPYALEPEGNGRRINLGAYGNTLVASLSSPRSGGTVFKFR